MPFQPSTNPSWIACNRSAAESLHVYRERLNQFKEFMVVKLKANPEYQRFNDFKLPVHRNSKARGDACHHHLSSPKRARDRNRSCASIPCSANLYQPDYHHGKWFLSIDLIAANFNFFPKLFYGCATWPELLELCFLHWYADAADETRARLAMVTTLTLLTRTRIMTMMLKLMLTLTLSITLTMGGGDDGVDRVSYPDAGAEAASKSAAAPAG